MNSIFGNYTLQDVKKLERNTMLSHLGIEITSIDNNAVKGKMPVYHRTCQPMGILHGGASCALAESLASIGAFLTLKDDTYVAVGMEINANHVRPVKEGFVYGTAKPFHLGKKTQVWTIEILNEKNQPVCISRMTIAIGRLQLKV